jgi:hypothetical protein
MKLIKLLLLLLLLVDTPKTSAQCSEEDQIKVIEAETKVTFKICSIIFSLVLICNLYHM